MFLSINDVFYSNYLGVVVLEADPLVASFIFEAIPLATLGWDLPALVRLDALLPSGVLNI
tara:strand:+ start:47 stop:226 length:180 start_codon:yes stop_codon:yes gene_type:complete